MFVRREDAERFIQEVHGDDAEIAATLRVEERELKTSGLNKCSGATHLVERCHSLSSPSFSKKSTDGPSLNDGVDDHGVGAGAAIATRTLFFT